MKKSIVLLLCAVFTAGIAQAQLRKIPAEVTTAFNTSFPDAKNVSWKDNLTNFEANFSEGAATVSAKFNNKGEWLETNKKIALDAVASVKDGFSKSKYRDWNLREVKEIREKGKDVEYRVYVSKSDVQKKYLYFNGRGELKREALTL